MTIYVLGTGWMGSISYPYAFHRSLHFIIYAKTESTSLLQVTGLWNLSWGHTLRIESLVSVLSRGLEDSIWEKALFGSSIFFIACFFSFPGEFSLSEVPVGLSIPVFQPHNRKDLWPRLDSPCAPPHTPHLTRSLWLAHVWAWNRARPVRVSWDDH